MAMAVLALPLCIEQSVGGQCHAGVVFAPQRHAVARRRARWKFDFRQMPGAAFESDAGAGNVHRTIQAANVNYPVSIHVFMHFNFEKLGPDSRRVPELFDNDCRASNRPPK